MQTLFHITNDSNYKIGGTIITTDDLNPFICGIINSIKENSSNPESGELIKYSETIHSKYEDLDFVYTGTDNEKVDKLSNRSSEFHGLSTKLNNSLFRYLAYIREELFERIRLTEFSELPSRLKGVWLCDQESLPTWWNDIGKSQSSILEVLLDENCKLLRTNSNLIQTETFSIDRYEKIARDYWRGVIEDERFHEILVEGKMQIVNKFNSLEEFLNR